MNCFKTLLLLCSLLITSPSKGQDGRDSLIVAKIEAVTSEDLITFRPTVQNNGIYHYDLDFLMLVKKTDANKNLSINQQKGKFTLEPRSVEHTSELQSRPQLVCRLLLEKKKIGCGRFSMLPCYGRPRWSAIRLICHPICHPRPRA